MIKAHIFTAKSRTDIAKAGRGLLLILLCLTFMNGLRQWCNPHTAQEYFNGNRDAALYYIDTGVFACILFLNWVIKGYWTSVLISCSWMAWNCIEVVREAIFMLIVVALKDEHYDMVASPHQRTVNQLFDEIYRGSHHNIGPDIGKIVGVLTLVLAVQMFRLRKVKDLEAAPKKELLKKAA